MRRRWQLILPIIGLGIFLLLSYWSYQINQEEKVHSDRYFYWGSSIRLDRDPMQRHPIDRDHVGMVLQAVYIDPGWFENILLVSAIPAFLLEYAIVSGLGRLGINQVVSFMITMPVLILAWFYIVGWLIDRWRNRKKRKRFVAG